MFGFGLFSTHLPYLVLIVGYIACWCWNFQAKPSASDEGEPQAITIEVAGQSVSLSGEEVLTLTPFHAAILSESSDVIQPLYYTHEKDKPRPNYSVPIIAGTHNAFSFLRPPPCFQA